MGSSVVDHSMRSIASSGLLPSGTGFIAAAFQSVSVFPAACMASSSAAECRTIFPFFLLMASPHRNDPDRGVAPHPNDREELAAEQCDRFPTLLVAARRRLMDRWPAVEKLEGVREIETSLLQDFLT